MFVLAAKLKTTPYATITDRVVFLHGALRNPALSMLHKALDAGFMSSWPEIISELVRTPPLDMQQWCKGILTIQDATPG